MRKKFFYLYGMKVIWNGLFFEMPDEERKIFG
jgi:hypothetical protein